MSVFDNRIEDDLLEEVEYTRRTHQLTKDQVIRLLVKILHYIVESWD